MMISLPLLTKSYKKCIILWAKLPVERNSKQWENFIFSDEKLSLDGLDGLAYYGYDLRHEKNYKMSLHIEGGPVKI